MTKPERKSFCRIYRATFNRGKIPSPKEWYIRNGKNIHAITTDIRWEYRKVNSNDNEDLELMTDNFLRSIGEK